MFTNLFGSYLVDNDIITKQQYRDIKEAGTKIRVKLGLIAVAEKLITQKQADYINLKQSTVDQRFGDIAVDLGYLTHDQVKRLLDMQGNPYICFVQAVTDLGIMTIEDVEKYLADYQKSKGFTSMDMDAVKSGDIDRIIPLILPDDMDWNQAEHIAVMIRTLNRLACDDINLKRPIYTDRYEAKAYAMQSMFGDLKSSTVVAGSIEGMLAIADGFAKDSFGTLNYEALDSIGEYINIGNGLFATAASLDMVEISLCPPELSENEAVLKGDKICVIPLVINGFDVNLIVSIGSQIEVAN